jgi:hypothetical protein
LGSELDLALGWVSGLLTELESGSESELATLSELAKDSARESELLSDSESALATLLELGKDWGPELELLSDSELVLVLALETV